MSAQSFTNQKSLPTFEFTKRKRWADLLIAELADAIILILSYNPCKILYCGTGVSELLGWKEEELIDVDIAELLDADDHSNFMTKCDESMRANTEFLAYLRLKHKEVASATYSQQQQPADITHSLFELRGRPHYTPHPNNSPTEHTTSMDFRCFFAVAKPYPSRNATMLNEFLELKMQNELLQQRLNMLRERAPIPMAMTDSAASTPNSSNGAPSPLANGTPQATAPYASPSPQMTMHPGPMPGGNFYINTKVPYEEMLSSPQTYDRPTYSNSANVNASTSSSSVSPVLLSVTEAAGNSNAFETAPGNGKNGKQEAPEELGDVEGAKKKKVKKAHETDKYVCITCGRTESPEWRKGPLGPKTLCNACGLRYAKQVKK